MLVLLVVAAAAAGVYFYWTRVVLAPRASVVADAGAPSNAGRPRHKRRRRGARRLARNDVPRNDTFEGAPPTYAAPSEEPSAPAENAAPLAENRAPVAPGGSTTTEAAPSDVFGTLTSLSQAAGGGKQAVAVAEPAPRKLSTADLRAVAQGEDLSKPEVTRLDLSDATPELTQDAIDARFHAKEDAVMGCISRARPDDYTWIPGRVVVTFRILRAGGVKGVRVEAPAILQRGGLYGCVKGVVGGLKFPAGTMNQVVTYPFSLT